jgi:hypothetical protein
LGEESAGARGVERSSKQVDSQACGVGGAEADRVEVMDVAAASKCIDKGWRGVQGPGA